MCIRIIAKDLAVTITEDIVILATITATVTATETMLTPTTILATETEETSMQSLTSNNSFRSLLEIKWQEYCGSYHCTNKNHDFHLFQFTIWLTVVVSHSQFYLLCYRIPRLSHWSPAFPRYNAPMSQTTKLTIINHDNRTCSSNPRIGCMYITNVVTKIKPPINNSLIPKPNVFSSRSSRLTIPIQS
jgi:hypothetical protein